MTNSMTATLNLFRIRLGIFALAMTLPFSAGASENLYQVLGIKSSADAAELKNARNKLVLRMHSDVNRDGDQDAVAAVNNAYFVLKNEDLRFYYDKISQSGRYHSRWESIPFRENLARMRSAYGARPVAPPDPSNEILALLVSGQIDAFLRANPNLRVSDSKLQLAILDSLGALDLRMQKAVAYIIVNHFSVVDPRVQTSLEALVRESQLEEFRYNFLQRLMASRPVNWISRERVRELLEVAEVKRLDRDPRAADILLNRGAFFTPIAYLRLVQNALTKPDAHLAAVLARLDNIPADVDCIAQTKALMTIPLMAPAAARLLYFAGMSGRTRLSAGDLSMIESHSSLLTFIELRQLKTCAADLR